MKACTVCKRKKLSSDFYSDRRNSTGLTSQCKECTRGYRDRLRRTAIDAYGGECACCGESELRFLTIDHVGGWGAEHRKQLKIDVYKWLKREGYPQDGRIRVLCWNCNCAQGMYGICH